MGSDLHIANHTLESRAADLAVSRARYGHAVSGTNDGIWGWIPATGEDYLSPRGKQLLGYEDHQLTNVQETFFDRINPEDKALVRRAAQAHIDERKPFDVELRMRCKRGLAQGSDPRRKVRTGGQLGVKRQVRGRRDRLPAAKGALCRANCQRRVERPVRVTGAEREHEQDGRSETGGQQGHGSAIARRARSASGRGIMKAAGPAIFRPTQR